MKLPNLTMPGKPSLQEYAKNVAVMWKDIVEDKEFMNSLSENHQNLAKEMNKELNNARRED